MDRNASVRATSAKLVLRQLDAVIKRCATLNRVTTSEDVPHVLVMVTDATVPMIAALVIATNPLVDVDDSVDTDEK
ncbi:hypothetical protein Ciccas_014599 [Cichlidogyrus casuarinus]|uniref:Uncharacterized protein n=1 Tax=Cichlidogyrus casuarinus TaxID=1844966 RepID=A0ABD2PHZ2_9PLAT